MSGYDCAAAIQDVYQSAFDEEGADPAFWMRYFNPSPDADIFSDDAESECIAAWASGGHAIGCISAPVPQSLLSGSEAEGQADAQAFCASMLSAYLAVGPLDLPSNNQLYCWLDQEYGTSLSLPYWDGWALYIANYNFASLNTYPLYPCVYCTPSSPYPNCSTFAQATGLAIPEAIWVPVPEFCNGLSDPPSWQAEGCGSGAKVTTKLWQYREEGVCGLSAAVDLDVGAPGFSTQSFCFDLAANP
jgi:hypothetical protein